MPPAEPKPSSLCDEVAAAAWCMPSRVDWTFASLRVDLPMVGVGAKPISLGSFCFAIFSKTNFTFYAKEALLADSAKLGSTNDSQNL